MNAVLGTPMARRDGRAKVTGAATYALDVAAPGLLHAVLVVSPVTLGRIASMDTAEAERMPGVGLVLTHRNMPRLAPDTNMFAGGHAHASFRPLEGEEIRYHGQAVALVAADTRVQAEAAAGAVRVAYEARAGAKASLDDPGLEAKEVEDIRVEIGDAEAAFRASAVTVEAEFETPAQHHNPIELFATTALWRGDELEVHAPSQWVGGTRAGLCKAFGLPPDKVRVVCPYVGGGFGSKALTTGTVLMTAAAARLAGRPVKLQVSREHGYTTASFRPSTRTAVKLGADRDGRLRSLIYESRGQTSRFDDMVFPGGDVAARMYKFDAVLARESVVPTDVNTPGFMRAPAETPSFFAFESAVDELAHALGRDPVELRRTNEPARDPVKDIPWSSRRLVDCYARAAEIFGWSRRDARPGSMTEGGELVGWGCATAVYPAFITSSAASVRVTQEGRAVVRTSAADLGTGTYTVLAQVVADALGLPAERVSVDLGDTDFAPGNCAGGSTTAVATGNAARVAAEEARAMLLRAATEQDGPFRGRDPATLRVEGGRVVAGGESRSVGEVLAASARGFVEATTQWSHPDLPAEQAATLWRGGFPQFGAGLGKMSAYAYGAQFVEVRINPRTRTIRAPRVVGVFDGGAILNPRTARSQLVGGMVWGVSNALLEESEVDRRHARFVNRNLAEYHVAVNADVREVVAETLGDPDPYTGPLGAKGLGEIGIVGVAPAVANAVFHATGVRVRKTPILIEDILPRAA